MTFVMCSWKSVSYVFKMCRDDNKYIYIYIYIYLYIVRYGVCNMYGGVR